MALKNAPYITSVDCIRSIPSESYGGEFHKLLLNSVLIETVSVLYISTFLNPGSVYDILYFIPISFIFEVIFDFFHYLTHYMMHNIPYLYKNSHKMHHKFQHPSAITTYYQHPADIFLTNVLPFFCTLYIMMQYITISFYTFSLLNMYKTYIEIAGHAGKQLTHTSSFPQCIWLPRLLGIGLSIEDHDAHHSKNNCNYSKRFTLWDKVFGTYYTPASVIVS